MRGCKKSTSSTPSIKAHLAAVRGLPTKKFLNQVRQTRRTQLSVAAKVVRPTDLLNNVKS